MTALRKTVFFEQHRQLGAKMVDFGGWEMPLQYPNGIVFEHLETRRQAGLFDVSHMGRFLVRGRGAVAFLQHALTNSAARLDPEEKGAQYTLIPNETGGAVDDAYLYCFEAGEYLLVVNASNRLKDRDHLQALAAPFADLELTDVSRDLAMLALQGPRSEEILTHVIESGPLPALFRNAVGVVDMGGTRVKLARTGYTGEPLCFELFIERDRGPRLWDRLLEEGAVPVGLGARDTLRLEAGLPLYGHELGEDREGNEIPIPAVPLTRSAVSFSPLKGDFVGKAILKKQFEALDRILARDFSRLPDLPRLIRPVAVTGRGIARPGAGVFRGDRQVGYVTSGTMVPYWVFEGEGPGSGPTDIHKLRPLCLAYVDGDIMVGDDLGLDIRGKRVEARAVTAHLRTDLPPLARPLVV